MNAGEITLRLPLHEKDVFLNDDFSKNKQCPSQPSPQTVTCIAFWVLLKRNRKVLDGLHQYWNKY